MGPATTLIMVFGKLFEGDKPRFAALEVLKYVGPGFLVAVGFIDPGNWAANIGAGSGHGYALLWIVTLSTAMLIVLQHNAAHLGIVSGLCLAEASTKYLGRLGSRALLATAVGAAVSTALAELLGAAIGLQMLFRVPLWLGATLTAAASAGVLLTNGYRRVEKWVIAFVALIGLCFLFELHLVAVDWHAAARGWLVPTLPPGSMPIVMSVLGAVVMPHNLFLHSEIIQSRQWNLEGEAAIGRRLKYEFVDTLLAMLVGWAINSAMILVAAAVFYRHGAVVTELPQAQATLAPLLGQAAATVFAIGLVLAGFSSSVTASMAGASIFAGIFSEPYDPADNHSRIGIAITLGGALLAIAFVTDPFRGLLWSQMALSVQLPLTIVAQIVLTSSKRVMGRHANPPFTKGVLWLVAMVVAVLNVLLLRDLISS